MTIEQLRVIAQNTFNKAAALNRASNDLTRFMSNVVRQVAEENPYSGTIDVDAFVAIQAPLYQDLLDELTAKYNELVP